jgi:hypothetical protein
VGLVDKPMVLIFDRIFKLVFQKKFMMKLNKIFKKCFLEIGGQDDRDVHWYLKERPKRISRNSFFQAVVWAIWVAGKSRKAAEKFLDRAEKNGFSWNFTVVGSWDRQHLLRFMKKLHTHPVPEGARKRWEAIYSIARELKTYRSEVDFRRSFFNGKAKSADLDKNDVKNLTNRNLPWIGKANASFILRNMGGEFIKHDRWIKAFLRYYKMSLDDLEKKLQALDIPLGLFDIVLWAYCEKFIGKTEKFNEHFKQVGVA